jgi:hypothetical protein
MTGVSCNTNSSRKKYNQVRGRRDVDVITSCLLRSSAGIGFSRSLRATSTCKSWLSIAVENMRCVAFRQTSNKVTLVNHSSLSSFSIPLAAAQFAYTEMKIFVVLFLIAPLLLLLSLASARLHEANDERELAPPCDTTKMGPPACEETWWGWECNFRNCQVHQGKCNTQSGDWKGHKTWCECTFCDPHN